ncbi:bacitracin ABC transporter permease [Pradoshia eiseniae]|uniref:Bacitracin ABC transporter permease n=1 Tax=Pradoshia eiseniae TaxID=2064768 RepID=A0A2S7MX50_9BACI|nr:ABC transporter permease [Pradoshia eiseniae]PQD94364.1 bacitracin ABC transporter permease [Pradoshia eiseniae]
MSTGKLISQSLKKNLKNYYLYVFALIFSAALYFSFVTLQYDPAMDAAEGSIKGEAAMGVASILLIAIVAVFLAYANNLFMKRRSKEIGLYQLVGMSKQKVFWILSVENSILYFGALLGGVFLGFASSKLLMMLLINIAGTEDVASLRFSGAALAQTLIVFFGIFLITLLMNYFYIKRKGILSLFHTESTTEMKAGKISIWEILIGLIGILSIATGYYVSSKLFSGDFSTTNELLFAMLFILAAVIIGTYLFYKGSIRFLFNLLRKKKNGYLTIRDVLSLSSIMFRMKSNALLLTIITTVSALAIGLLSLSYISYYSVEKTAQSNVAADFSFANQEDYATFTDLLAENQITFTDKEVKIVQAYTDLSDVMSTRYFEAMDYNQTRKTMPVISETAIKGLDLAKDESMMSGFSDDDASLFQMKDSGKLIIEGPNGAIETSFMGLEREFLVSSYFTFGMPVLLVDQSVFDEIAKKPDPSIQMESTVYNGITINHEANLDKANELFMQASTDDYMNKSRPQLIVDMKTMMGLTMFIVAFLGLTFLITSGCILYFKQMDEGEDELPNYTILRKLGFTEQDMLKGIAAKQLFNFGIPLILGLSHSYFAVQSGWFLFGTELWAPMLIVMVIYTVLYSIFGLLSVLYYKKLIKDSL